MAYQFVNQKKATALITAAGTADTYKIAGVNGEQTNANNYRTAMNGLLYIVGKESDISAGLGRTISQDVEESP